MKKTAIKILVLLFICIIIVSCKEDFLNTPPANLLTSVGFYQTPTQANQGIVGIYTDLRPLANDEFLFMSEYRSDNTWILPVTDGYREYSEIGNFRAGNDIRTFNSTWNEWYKVIYDANTALSKIPNIDFGSNTTLKNQLLGEAHFLRGWAYFELVRLFGNIPIIDKTMSPNEVAGISQSSARDVYDKIVVPDLKTSKNLLPLNIDMKDAVGTSVGATGRVDKIAARAMLGRVYMTMNGFPLNDASVLDSAEVELLAVKQYSEQNGDKYWAPNITEWRKQWISENNNKYSIFAIQYRSGGAGNTAIFNFSPPLPPSYTTIIISGTPVYVEKSLMYEFSKLQEKTGAADLRGEGHSYLLGYEKEGNFTKYSNATEDFKLSDGTVVKVNTQTIIYKYLNSLKKRAALGYTANIETTMKDYNDWPVNFPVIRFEDVLLMYAEILVKKNDISGAMTIVNRIRQRAGCDDAIATNSDEALMAVKLERRIELFAEGVRWFDIVRWGEWKSSISEMFNRYNNPVGVYQANLRDGCYLYPIPLTQMDIKRGVYKQNEGY